ncbi:hypothetical protein BH09PAT3_BH09PAT3_3230 [soil metagenome]
MNLFKRYIAVLASLVCLTMFVPASASAWSPFGSVDCSGRAKQSAVCADRSKTADPIAGSDGIVMKIVNLVAIVSGSIAIIIIVLAGLRFVTSGGSSEDVAGARRALIYAVIGLVVLVLARTLVAFIVGKL